MPGSMSQADLIGDLKSSLQDAASIFTAASDGDFKRHLNTAALDFVRARPRKFLGSLTVIADLSTYDSPDDLVKFHSHLWGIVPVTRARPWERIWPGRLPEVHVAEIESVRKLVLTPAPSLQQITVLGADFRYYYFAKHAIDADPAKTTIAAGDRQLLLLRAQAEAMRELAIRNLHKPVQLRDGAGQGARNGTPAALFEALLDEFERAA